MSELTSDDKYLTKEVKGISAPKRKKLGEILVEKGVITTFTVDRILTLSSKAGKRFGTTLEEIGLVTGEELAQALASQYNCKIINNIANYQYHPNILKLVNVEAAVEHTVFPLKVQNNTLALAMMDPTNEKLINNLKQDIQMQIYPFIATRKEINCAIAKHYLNRAMSEKDENAILVVDDDKLILAMISNMLQNEGYKIITASDGMEAYKKIICSKPKLIITDKEMPKFNGYALLDSLKRIPETKMIPVILISGSTKPDDEAIAYEKGFFDYISKPVKEITLRAKVKRALKSNNSLLPTQF